MVVVVPDEPTAGGTYQVRVTITGSFGQPQVGTVTCTLGSDPGDPQVTATLSSDGTATLTFNLAGMSGNVDLFCFFGPLAEQPQYITSFTLP